MAIHRYLLPFSILLGSAIISQSKSDVRPDANTQDVVRAKRFEVVDDNGKTRGVFEVVPDGKARLMLFDEDGNTRGTFAVARNGVVVGLFDGNGKTRASLGVTPDGASSLSLSDKHQKPRMSLSLLPDGKSGMVITDGDGKARVKLAVQPDGTPVFGLGEKDEDGATALVWAVAAFVC